MTLPELPKPFCTEYDDIDKVEIPCYSSAQMRAYALEAVKQEREACAKACFDVQIDHAFSNTLKACAAAIRHRSQG